MENNTTSILDFVNQSAGVISNALGEFGYTLNVLLIVLGALDLIATWLFPNSIVMRIPKIIRLVSMLIKAFKYMERGFDKLEKSRGGMDLDREFPDKQKES